MMIVVAALFVLAAQTPPSADAALGELRARHDAADCDVVIAAAPALEADARATPAQRREAALRRGDCLVTIGNIREATEVFLRVFDADVDLVVPFEIEPRVQILVEAARADVVKRREREALERREKLVERIELVVAPPAALKGGSRAVFDVALVDPDGLVRSMRIDFKKQGDPEFYALPVVRRADGTWRGEVPGAYTRSANGAVLEWYVTASDVAGERLKSFGARAAPQVLHILPGSVVAQDLRANERNSHPVRIGAAAAATPVAVGLGMLGGVVAAYGVAALVDTLFTQGGVAFALGLVAFPSLLAGFAAAAIANELIEVGDAVWVAGLVGALTALGGGAFAAAVLSGDLSWFVAGAGAWTLAGLAAGGVTTTLVVLDPPEE